jgi:hypothetical protein
MTIALSAPAAVAVSLLSVSLLSAPHLGMDGIVLVKILCFYKPLSVLLFVFISAVIIYSIRARRRYSSRLEASTLIFLFSVLYAWLWFSLNQSVPDYEPLCSLF